MSILDIDNDTRLYRVPGDLLVTPTGLRRTLVIGSCLSEGFAGITHLHPEGCKSDFILFNNHAKLPENPPQPVSAYDFQLLQIPLRSVLPEGAYFQISYNAPEELERAFVEACDRLRTFLENGLRWNREYGILTFVANFMVPQQSSAGRLLPKNDLRDMQHFVSRLNDVISDEIRAYKNVFISDIDQICSTFGKKHFQDDILWQYNHGGMINDNDYRLDGDRLEPFRPVSELYTIKDAEFVRAWWSELVASYRTVRRIDSVKLVIVDLDDTLWRGLVVEHGPSQSTLEGWPTGFIEALLMLKKRGIMLAIASKNDEEKIEAVWPRVAKRRISLEDFAVRKINWKPKVENISEIISEVNVLPSSVVFIDDNPLERAAVKAAFPDIRVLGENHYYLRRILLWAPETQVPVISKESARRTEMVQAQIQREGNRKGLSREEFFQNLDLKISPLVITTRDDPSFERAFELINKTNQFNTTGKRWDAAEAQDFFLSEGSFFTFEVEDKFTSYGLVGVAIVSASGRIEQFVMSCRVFGMEIEPSMVREIGRWLASRGIEKLVGLITETADNSLSRDLYLRSGMHRIDDTEFSALVAELPVSAPHLSIAALSTL